MQTTPQIFFLIPLTGLALALCAGPVRADVGLLAVAQHWDPHRPDQTDKVTLVDDPSAISDGLQRVWAQVSPLMCETLKAQMGLGGAAHGQTLRNITCLLDDRVTFTLTQVNATTLRATALASGYVEATTTTPDIALGVGLDKATDPRFSLALTAKFDLTFAVQPNREQTLRVSKAMFTLNNATLDSHGVTGDILKFLATDLSPFFGGPDYKQLAENAINAVSADVANQFNAGLAGINGQLAGPSDLVRSELLVRSNQLRIAFAPPLAVPRTDGRMSGLLRWDPAEFTPRKGCNSFTVAASVQVGPAPVFTGGGAPMQALGSFQASPNDASSCIFTLNGIASDWPNRLGSQVLDPPVVNATTNYRTVFSLAPDGWPGASITPQPLADARNYKVLTYTLKTPPMVDARDMATRDYRINPEINRDPRINTETRIDRLAPLAIPAEQPAVQATSDAKRLNPASRVNATKVIPQVTPAVTPANPVH